MKPKAEILQTALDYVIKVVIIQTTSNRCSSRAF